MTGSARRSILFVNNFAGPTLGGGEVHLMHLVRAAREAGWDVHVVAARGSALATQAAGAGAGVTELDFGPAQAAQAPAHIREAIAGSGARVVVGTGFLTNACVRRAVSDGSVAVVNIAHTEPDAARHEGSGPLRLAMRRRVDATYRTRVDAFVAISSAVRNALCAQGVEPERVHLIPNGVDVAEVRRGAAAAAAVDAAAAADAGPAGLSGPGPLVGCVARLAPVKGVEYFVRMASAVVSALPDVRFVVAGSGPEESRLREIAYAGDLEERLAFLGHVPAAPVLSACDIVVVPSLSEGFSLVAAEAMALGKPVVATCVGGVVDVVADGETGILVPPADPGALAAAVVELLRDPARAAAMGAAGARRVEERFTVERMVEDYLGLFGTLAAVR